MSNPNSDTGASAWHTRAEELADWAFAHVFVRTDRYGGYYRKDGRTEKCARPAKGAKVDALSRAVVVRHFRATSADDVIGAYALTAGEGCVGRWAAVDVDAHTAADDPARNERYALHLYRKAAALGFRALLTTAGGGSYHLWVLLDRTVPGLTLYTFARWLVTDAKEHGYLQPPESFPKQARVPDGKFGNWLRLPGRHHTRAAFASVFDGSDWVQGEPAVSHLLSLAGESPDLIPVDARPAERVKNAQTNKPSGTSRAHAVRPDVFAEFNRRTALDAVVAWHEASGHTATRRGADRVDFCRAGKDGGESFNVALVEGVPVTFNFSANAGLPENRGLSPSQLRCLLERGSCDTATMRAFAPVLRAELGWGPAGGSGAGRASGDGAEAKNSAGEDIPQAGERFHDTDLANAGRLVADSREAMLYVADWKRWCVFDGCRWAVDASGAVAAGLAHQTLRRMADAAAEQIAAAARLAAGAGCAAEEAAAAGAMATARAELTWAKKSQDAKRVAAMLEMAKPYALVSVGADTFDTHPHLLNCANGTVDLQTGELREHRREDCLTKLCPTPFDPTAPAPTYRTFLDTVIPHPATAEYVRRLSGYAATGEATDETLHLFHGTGANGKGKLLDLWVNVLGDGEYAATVPAELIADDGGSRHPTERTLLRGARLAVCEETGEGEALNAKRVKNLTGGGRIVARGVYQNFYTFAPTHTLVLATNHLPTVKVNDHATWRRLRVVTFPHTFWTEADRLAKPDGSYPADRRADAGLPDRLRAEAPGVLADMVANAVAFYAAGRRLTPPDEVVRAGAKYRDRQDVIGRFLEFQTRRDAEGRGTRGGELFHAFQRWYKAEVEPDGLDCPRSGTFYSAAEERFGEPRKVKGYMTYAARLCSRGEREAGGEGGDLEAER